MPVRECFDRRGRDRGYGRENYLMLAIVREYLLGLFRWPSDTHRGRDNIEDDRHRQTRLSLCCEAAFGCLARFVDDVCAQTK